MSAQDDAQVRTRARDHLANERTYLAWLRTGANVMVLGLAIARFTSNAGGRALAAGAVLVAVGGTGLVYGTVRYRQVNREIEHGEYTTGTRGAAPTIASALLIAAVIAAVVLLYL